VNALDVPRPVDTAHEYGLIRVWDNGSGPGPSSAHVVIAGFNATLKDPPPWGLSRVAWAYAPLRACVRPPPPLTGLLYERLSIAPERRKIPQDPQHELRPQLGAQLRQHVRAEARDTLGLEQDGHA